MKRILAFFLPLVFLAAAAQAEIPRPSEVTNCLLPEGREYVCYSDKECNEYLKGYNAVMTMRYSQPGEFFGLGQGEEHPVVWINLYWDHLNMLMLGKMEAEKRDGKWYIKQWIAIYDSDCQLLHEDYAEGFKKKKQEDQ